MKVYYSEDHNLHHPPYEIFEYGQRIEYYEQPSRIDNILNVMREDPRFELLTAENFGLEPILRTHSPTYVNFLRTIYRDWLTTAEDVPDGQGLFPTTRPNARVSEQANGPFALLGKYVTDLSAPIHENTYIAALNSAHCALSASNALLNGDFVAIGLCRPPGHHAGVSNAAGYCYLNNTAIAGNWLSRSGKVAILDIDYHAGNGTQEIFYDRTDVLTLSIHADPAFDYPYFVGFGDEIGENEGYGYHQNYPLPIGTEKEAYIETLYKAIHRIKEFAPDHLVLAAGFDTYKDDPLCSFKLSGKTYTKIGEAIAALGIKTQINLEGGYYIPKLGANLKKLVEPFM